LPLVTTKVDWPTMLTLVSTGIESGTITMEQVDAACKKFDVDSYPTLVARPDLITPVHDELFK